MATRSMAPGMAQLFMAQLVFLWSGPSQAWLHRKAVSSCSRTRPICDPFHRSPIQRAVLQQWLKARNVHASLLIGTDFSISHTRSLLGSLTLPAHSGRTPRACLVDMGGVPMGRSLCTHPVHASGAHGCPPWSKVSLFFYFLFSFSFFFFYQNCTQVKFI